MDAPSRGHALRRLGPTVLVVALLVTWLAPKPAATSAPTLLPRGTSVETYAESLAFPVDMAWVPGTNKIFFTEKNTGRVRVMKGRTLLERPCVDLDVQAAGERGALGITLHPRFKKNGFLYVFYTNSSPLEHRVTRFTVRRNRCRAARHIVRGLDASSSGYHNGGQLDFMGGKLFVSTGEGHDPAEAQSKTNRLGKILRLEPNGSVPEGNPFGNAIWTYGHRNPFGLAAANGRLYSSENGPNCDDELNLIEPGRNYGWGAGYDCGTAGVGERPTPPLVRWTPPIVPTDLTFYKGKVRSLSGSLYMGDFGSGGLHRFVMNEGGTRVTDDRIVYTAPGGIVDVSKGPGGWLYLLTPDSILRIVRD